MLPVKIRPAIPEPWQVEHEINNKIGITFFCQIFADLAFYRCIKLINPMQNDDFTTHYSGIEAILHV